MRNSLIIILLAILLSCAFPTPLFAIDRIMDMVPEKPPATDFELPGVDSKPHRLSDYRGKMVLINFWATWCRPCRKEMPALDKLDRFLKDKGLVVLAVHVGPSIDNIKNFLTTTPVGLQILINDAIDLPGWRVTRLPVTYLVNRKGRLIAWALGERQWDSAQMIRFLEDHLDSRYGFMVHEMHPTGLTDYDGAGIARHKGRR